jgi:hypothetical protein
MKVTLKYDNGTSRVVELPDAPLLEMAQRQADEEDMIARERAKPKPTSIALGDKP